MTKVWGGVAHLWICWLGWGTAGPSTTLRSGRDDKGWGERSHFRFAVVGMGNRRSLPLRCASVGMTKVWGSVDTLDLQLLRMGEPQVPPLRCASVGMTKVVGSVAIYGFAELVMVNAGPSTTLRFGRDDKVGGSVAILDLRLLGWCTAGPSTTLRFGRDDKGWGGVAILDLRCWDGELQIPPLRSPGFPVGLGGVVAVHAPFFTEEPHTRPCPVTRGRKSGYASVGMTKGRAARSDWFARWMGTAGPSTSLPRISCGLGGFGALHAPFFTERRTRCLVQRNVAGNPGTLRSG